MLQVRQVIPEPSWFALYASNNPSDPRRLNRIRPVALSQPIGEELDIQRVALMTPVPLVGPARVTAPDPAVVACRSLVTPHRVLTEADAGETATRIRVAVVRVRQRSRRTPHVSEFHSPGRYHRNE